MAFSIQKPNNNIESEDIQQFKDRRVSIKELLIYCTETNCSDLYIKVGEKPYISRFGTLIELPCAELSNNDWFEFFDLYVKEEFNAQYVREKMYDTAIEILIPEESSLYNKYPSPYFRYRASFGYSMGKNICTFRMIRPEAPSFNSINYPPDCLEALKKSFQHKTGITMWTGATGSGKNLHKDTIIPTPNGFVRLKDIKIGDIIYNEYKRETKVIDKYSPKEDKFYEIKFKDGTIIKAGGGHLWKVREEKTYKCYDKIVDTNYIYSNFFKSRFTIIREKPVDNSYSKRYFDFERIKPIDGDYRDYICLAVDSPTHLFLCTEKYIPTHNTTTLVACINDFSQKGGLLDNKVFITLEDPIEYEFKSTPSFKVVQKELGKDFKNYKNGIIQALREHPTHILVGEARDKEVITAVIEACRTGHYCTTSFHASTVSGTISRILYYLDNDINLAYDLIINLNGIFSQRLLKREDKYEVDVQYMLFNNKITKIILDAVDSGKNMQIVVDGLFKDKELLDSGDVKDWTYDEV